MVRIKINGVEYLVKQSISVLEMSRYIGIFIPRFCYHEILSVAGNCRMCLVEIEGVEKPVASCVTLVDNGMSVWLDTPFVKKARENVVEALLLNHPLDCPICDQAGECDLQDQTKLYGSDFSRVFINKRGVEDKNCGPLIKTIMTRCIHCTRCVRFSSEICGNDYLGTFSRGTSTEIGGYVSKIFRSELSGNVIDLCPVGALTSKPYAFRARPWELRLSEGVDLHDSLGSNCYVNHKESEISRITPKSNSNINGSLISDKARFSYDYNKNNRVRKIYKQHLFGGSYEISDWDMLTFQIDDTLYSTNQQNNICILVNEKSSAEALETLKLAENKFPEKVCVRVASSKIVNTSDLRNFKFYKNDVLIDFIENKSDICFILSSNLKIENAVLNSKLRSSYNNKYYKVYNLGRCVRYDIPGEFLNLTVDTLLKIWEGKDSYLSLKLVSFKNPLIIVGKSLENIVGSLNLFTNHIKLLFCNLGCINIRPYANSFGVDWLNIKSINSCNISKNKTKVLAFDLDDIVLSRKLLSKRGVRDSLFWFNSHGSELASLSYFIAPLKTNVEKNGTFYNFEGRPQFSRKILSSAALSRTTEWAVNGFFELSFSSLRPTHLRFVNEMLNNSNLFSSKKSKLSCTASFYKSGENISCISKYPLKSILEDFYTSDKDLKNSLTMLSCSSEIRKVETNFMKHLD